MFHLPAINVSHSIGNFFDTSDLQPLPPLYGPDEIAGLDQRLMGACIEPRGAAAQNGDRQIAAPGTA